MRTRVLVLMIAVLTVTGCTASAEPNQDMLDLCAVVGQEADYPEGWYAEQRIRDIPPAIFMIENVVGYCGATFGGPNGGGSGSHVMLYDTLENAQEAFRKFREDASSWEDEFPLSAFGDEHYAYRLEYGLESIGIRGFSYTTCFRKDRLVVRVSLNSDVPITQADVELLLDAILERMS